MASTLKDLPFAPSLKELYTLYEGLTHNYIKTSYEFIRREYKLPTKHQPNGLTNAQFIKFIEYIGLPHGYTAEDLPFEVNL